MTKEEREEAIRCLSVHSSTNGSGLCTDKKHYEAKQIAIKALEQEPRYNSINPELNGDLISRQEVLNAIITLWADKPFGNPALTEIKECVERVPSVTPICEEREKGECPYYAG